MEDEFNYEKSKDQVRPKLDLEIEYSTPAISQSFSENQEILWRQSFPNFTVGVNFSMPLGNNSASGDFNGEIQADSICLQNAKANGSRYFSAR